MHFNLYWYFCSSNGIDFETDEGLSPPKIGGLANLLDLVLSSNF